MKHEANFLITFLDDTKDLARQNIKGLEVDEMKNEDNHNAHHSSKHDKTKSKPCASMVIYPLKSSWHGIWKTIIKISFFWSYYNNFNHIGFVIGQAQYENDHALPSDQVSLKDFIKKIAIDTRSETIVDTICMIDICMTFFTAYVKDNKVENHLP